MKLQKRHIFIVGAVLAVLLALAAGLLFWGRRPFRGLEAADIASASVTLRPPDVTLELNGAEIEALAELLGTCASPGRTSPTRSTRDRPSNSQ